MGMVVVKVVVGSVNGNRQAPLKIITISGKRAIITVLASRSLKHASAVSMSPFCKIKKKPYQSLLSASPIALFFFHITPLSWVCFDCLAPGWLPAVVRGFGTQLFSKSHHDRPALGNGGGDGGVLIANHVNYWVIIIIIIITPHPCQKVWWEQVYRHTFKSPVCKFSLGRPICKWIHLTLCFTFKALSHRLS